MNLAALGEENVRTWGEYVSLHFEGRDFTNLEQQRAANRAAPPALLRPHRHERRPRARHARRPAALVQPRAGARDDPALPRPEHVGRADDARLPAPRARRRTLRHLVHAARSEEHTSEP